MKALVTVLFALFVVGCVGAPLPACEDGGVEGAAANCGLNVIRADGDGGLHAHFATCSDDWAASCDGESFGGHGGAAAICSNGVATCPAGGSPHCASIPCDGEVHYGAGYIGP